MNHNRRVKNLECLFSCTGVANTDDCKRNAFAAYILPPVISGRLNTKSSFAFQHGRIQIRAKLPRGDWLYPCEFYRKFCGSLYSYDISLINC